MTTTFSADDRERFVCADEYPVTLADGLVVNVHDDPDGWSDYSPEGTEYVGLTVEDPATGAHAGLWGIDVLPRQSGHDVRVMLAGDPLPDLLDECREQRDHELALAADAAARDISTV